MVFAEEFTKCGTGVQAGLATMLLLVWTHNNEQVNIAEQIIYLTCLCFIVQKW